MRLFPSRLPDTQMKHERVRKREYENTDGAAVSLQVMAFQRWLMQQFSPLPTRLPVWIMLNHAAGEDKTERIIVEFKCMETESCFAVAWPQMCVCMCVCRCETFCSCRKYGKPHLQMLLKVSFSPPQLRRVDGWNAFHGVSQGDAN